MHITIVGAGLMGSRIASLLVEEGHNVVIIDQSEHEIEMVTRQLDAKTLVGNGATPRVLREAEVERADLLIAATNNDETNVITCFLAKELGAKKTVARVRNPEYSGYLVSKAESPLLARRVVRPKSLGVDLFVNPETIVSQEIVMSLSSHHTTPVHEFAGGRVQIREFEIKDTALTNTPVQNIHFPEQCMIVAITRPTGTIIPAADTRLELGDHIHVVATREAMDELGTMFSQPMRPARSVIIFGGERVGFTIASTLEQQRSQIKIIEPSLSRCQEIAPKLKKTLVIQGEGTDKDSLIEEGVSSSDAFVAATSNDELNILAGLLAKSLHVHRSLVVTNKPGYIPMAEGLGIDVALSPLLLAAGKIVRFVSHAEVVTTALLAGEQAQAIEFVVGATAKIASKEFSTIEVPKGATISAIVHDGIASIPRKDSIIEPGDHVLVVCLPSVSRNLEELFH